MTRTPSEIWSSAAFRHEVTAWIDGQLPAYGRIRTGKVEQHRLRPWAVQLVAPTDAGRVWFKANAPGQAYEAAVVDLLSRWVPDQVLTPLAVDSARGWFLTAQHTDTFGDSPPDLRLWRRMVVEYAHLQQVTAEHVVELGATGLPVLDPLELGSVWDQAVDTLADGPAQLAARDVAALRARRAEVDRWAAVLAGSGVPLTLDHNDLHPHNVFLPLAGERRLRLLDFADGLVGHPFCTLLISLTQLADSLGAGHDVELAAVRDDYLRCWATYGDVASLVPVAGAAMRVARLNRMLSWQRLLPDMTDADLLTWGDAALRWAQRLGADPPV